MRPDTSGIRQDVQQPSGRGGQGAGGRGVLWALGPAWNVAEEHGGGPMGLPPNLCTTPLSEPQFLHL